MGMKNVKRIEVIVRALVIRGDQILVCMPVDGEYCYLPGGHVEPGESSISAIKREMLEECGVAVDVGELAAVSEERFIQGDKERHEINLVFHVKLSKPTLIVASVEDDIVFDWIGWNDLEPRGFVPKSFFSLGPLHVKHPTTWLGSNGSLV